MAADAKTVLVLVGPKGSGKSHVGRILDRCKGIAFVHSEGIFLRLLGELGENNPELERRGFAEVEREIERLLECKGAVCFETLAPSRHLQPVLRRLQARHRVVFVSVRAPLATCRQRVRLRDQAAHLPICDERLDRVNRISSEVELDWAAVIENGEPASEAQVLAALDGIV